MEFADGGDLLGKIRKTKEGPGYLREDEIWCIFLQLLAGTASLHRQNVIHRDLKVSQGDTVRQYFFVQRWQS